MKLLFFACERPALDILFEVTTSHTLDIHNTISKENDAVYKVKGLSSLETRMFNSEI